MWVWTMDWTLFDKKTEKKVTTLVLPLTGVQETSVQHVAIEIRR